MKHSHVLNAIFSQPWAITDAKMDAIEAFADRILAEDLESKLSQREKLPPRAVDIRKGVAVIPMMGVISPRMNLFSEISGGTSIERLQDDFMAAVGNPDVCAACFLIDSPGGNVQGVFEFADVIRTMRERTTKPILAHIEGQGCSAAYLIASQCDSVTATVGSEAGSIGVIARMKDMSRMEKNVGMETHIIRSDPTKAPGTGPVTSEQIGYMQERVNSLAEMFRSYVARARPQADLARAKAMSLPAMSSATGSTSLPSAMEIGLIDSITTLDVLVNSYGRK